MSIEKFSCVICRHLRRQFPAKADNCIIDYRPANPLQYLYKPQKSLAMFDHFYDLANIT
ncbi:hypothetical protein DPMN_137571 [Dreissena polymorpha]|uniref:Uncharacterized protein n=1 Tax=Dreissena polymorpha TaxID=45954 RepID=A0A9D4JET8_DREPO|nr:hypothetical protein DPMN_137571 [Dreissena polymorpha]